MSAMIALGICVVVSVAAAMIWTRAQRRRVDPAREVLDLRTIHQRFYAGSDVTPVDVEETYVRIAEATGVKAGMLRPTDRFDRELAPRAGWERDDPIFLFSDELARDAASVGVTVTLEEMVTVDDALRWMNLIRRRREVEHHWRQQ